MDLADGLETTIQLFLMHYTSMGIAHSHFLTEGSPGSFDYFMTQTFSEDDITKTHQFMSPDGSFIDVKLPVGSDYFRDADGNKVTRTKFEYMRDHIGYRIELRKLDFSKNLRRQGNFDVQLTLENLGFSAPINPRKVFFVLIDSDDKVFELETDVNLMTWQPYKPGDPNFETTPHTIELSRSLNENIAPGVYRLGLWMPDPYQSIRKNPLYAIRVANRDVPWWIDSEGQYGINILSNDIIVE